MKIKVTSLVDHHVTIKNAKGESIGLEGKESVELDTVVFSGYAAQCETFKNSGKIKLEEVKAKKEAATPKSNLTEALKKPAVKPDAKPTAKEAAPQKPARRARSSK